MTRQDDPKPARNDSIADATFAAHQYANAARLFHRAVAGYFGLGPADLKTLDLLRELGPMTVGDVAIHTELATASTTSLIDRLERKRLVRRERDRTDRRRVLVVPVRDHQEAMVPRFESLDRRMRGRLGGYTADKIQVIADFLGAAARDLLEEITRLSAREARRSASVDEALFDRRRRVV